MTRVVKWRNASLSSLGFPGMFAGHFVLGWVVTETGQMNSTTAFVKD